MTLVQNYYIFVIELLKVVKIQNNALNGMYSTLKAYKKEYPNNNDASSTTEKWNKNLEFQLNRKEKQSNLDLIQLDDKLEKGINTSSNQLENIEELTHGMENLNLDHQNESNNLKIGQYINTFEKENAINEENLLEIKKLENIIYDFEIKLQSKNIEHDKLTDEVKFILQREASKIDSLTNERIKLENEIQLILKNNEEILNEFQNVISNLQDNINEKNKQIENLVTENENLMIKINSKSDDMLKIQNKTEKMLLQKKIEDLEKENLKLNTEIQHTSNKLELEMLALQEKNKTLYSKAEKAIYEKEHMKLKMSDEIKACEKKLELLQENSNSKIFMLEMKYNNQLAENIKLKQITKTNSENLMKEIDKPTCEIEPNMYVYFLIYLL